MASNRGQDSGSSNTSNVNNDDWSTIEDPHERRRVQNRIAQRNYRVRKRNEQEELARIADNQEAAGAAYTAPEPEDLARNDNPSGLPWGSYSMKHVVEAGKAKERQSQTSREGSVAGPSNQGGNGSGGGTSRG